MLYIYYESSKSTYAYTCNNEIGTALSLKKSSGKWAFSNSLLFELVDILKREWNVFFKLITKYINVYKDKNFINLFCRAFHYRKKYSRDLFFLSDLLKFYKWLLAYDTFTSSPTLKNFLLNWNIDWVCKMPQFNDQNMDDMTWPRPKFYKNIELFVENKHK